MTRTAFIACWLAGAAVVSCGRTGLLTSDPCGEEGATEACNDVCGEGEMTCHAGRWGACEVAEATRACENACGDGTETCQSGAWGACEVARAERQCEGLCGEGVEACTSGTWGACAVPPADFPCENVCGQGLQHCEDERLGRCEVPVLLRDCATACGEGHEACSGGAWQACDAPQPNPPILHTSIRDFSPRTNPDFERPAGPGNSDDRAIVERLLGLDETPTYSGDPSIHTVTSAHTFYQWYHDGPDPSVPNDVPVSIRIDHDIPLVPSPGRPGFFIYDNRDFFPIDGLGFGNEGNAHNYHFTLTTKLTFRYVGGELFSFSGDDDMWVFINGSLAINLGGLHTPESSSVALDEHQAELGLVVGGTYPIHIFFAERHTVNSNFTLETSVADVGSCP